MIERHPGLSGGALTTRVTILSIMCLTVLGLTCRCLENGFEYIETNAMCPTEGHAEREKDGVPRVMESIYSTRCDF